jgi:hypothetical protein
MTSQPLHQSPEVVSGVCTASAAGELLRPYHTPEREKVAGKPWKIVMEEATLQQVLFLSTCASEVLA